MHTTIINPNVTLMVVIFPCGHASTRDPTALRLDSQFYLKPRSCKHPFDA